MVTPPGVSEEEVSMTFGIPIKGHGSSQWTPSSSSLDGFTGVLLSIYFVALFPSSLQTIPPSIQHSPRVKRHSPIHPPPP